MTTKMTQYKITEKKLYKEFKKTRIHTGLNGKNVQTEREKHQANNKFMFITAQKKFVDGADFHLVGTERNDCTRRNTKKKKGS